MNTSLAAYFGCLLLCLVTLFDPYEQGKTAPDQRERAIRLEIQVAAPVKKVWEAWTTPAGIKSFFGKDCRIEMRVLGPYEIFFNPDGPRGRRGAEDNFILAIQEGKMLAFTWDAPWTFPTIRQQRTSVVLRFSEVAPNQTRVTLTQSGWGEGEEWDKAYNYFISAWGEHVLPYLKHSLEAGPIDWNNPPRKVEKAVLIE